MIAASELGVRSVFLTGVAGFLGSHMADRLLSMGIAVVGYDNLSTGQREFVADASRNDRFRLVEGDVLDEPKLTAAMSGCDAVFHFAANADVRFGTEAPRRDLNQNIVATINVLEAMRANGIKKIAFISSSAVYGEPKVFPTPEDAAFPVQTSLYGASKVAGEGYVASYCEGFGMQSWIFRLVSLIGERYSHGHIFDFFSKLSEDPSKLTILGDGKQRKSSIYVGDCVEGILTAIARAPERVNVFNVGTEESSEVSQSARWIADAMGLNPSFQFTGGTQGWAGDNPIVLLDAKRLRGLGWRPTATIREGVTRTVNWLQANRWLLQRRH